MTAPPRTLPPSKDPELRLDPERGDAGGTAIGSLSPIPILEEARARLLAILAGKIERQGDLLSSPTYVHAEFRSALLRFVDDVEFLFDEKAKRLHFRSASRLGRSDFGVNRKRMEEIAREYQARTPGRK